jgi:hypothetical protein
MSILEQYKTLCIEHHRCTEWGSMHGKKFDGGGGGTGHLKEVSLSPTKLSYLYYQEYPGAQNYHRMPDSLQLYLEEAIRVYSRVLLDYALEAQKQELQGVAVKATAEYEQLLRDAGLAGTPSGS